MQKKVIKLVIQKQDLLEELKETVMLVMVVIRDLSYKVMRINSLLLRVVV